MYVIIETRKQKRTLKDDFTVVWTVPCHGFNSIKMAQDYLQEGEIFRKLLLKSKQHWRMRENSRNHVTFVNEHGSILMDHEIKSEE